MYHDVKICLSIFSSQFLPLKRRGAVKSFVLSAFRVPESQRLCMDAHHLVAMGAGDGRLEIGISYSISSAVRAGLPIDPVNLVTNDGMAKRGAVHIELVGATSDTGKNYPGNSVAVKLFASDNFVLGDGCLGVLKDLLADLLGGDSDQCALTVIGGDSHVGRIFIVHHEGHVDYTAVIGNVAAEQSFVLPGNLQVQREGRKRMR